MFLTFACGVVFAQDEKEDMSKYLEGAIPLEDGKVVFSTTIDAPGLSQEQVYDVARGWLELFLKERKIDRKDPDIKIFEEKENGELAVMPLYHLVFNKTFLSVDRSFITYRMKLTASDQRLDVRIWSIRYEYYVPDKKEPEKYTAENAITDEYALDKTKTKLNQLTSKFRIKTIDMVDGMYASLTKALGTEVSKIATATAKGERMAKQFSNPVVAKTVPVVNEQPSLAELQKQLADKKAEQNNLSGDVVAIVKEPVKTTEAKPAKKTPAPEVKPMQTAPVTTGGYTVVDVKEIPFNVLKVMNESGVSVSADGEAAEASWGGMAVLFGKNVAVCYVSPSMPAYSILENADTYSLRFSFDGKTVVLQCKKMLSQSLTESGVVDASIKAHSASNIPKMFIGEIMTAKIK